MALLHNNNTSDAFTSSFFFFSSSNYSAVDASAFHSILLSLCARVHTAHTSLCTASKQASVNTNI